MPPLDGDGRHRSGPAQGPPMGDRLGGDGPVAIPADYPEVVAIRA